MKLIYATGFSKTEKLEWKPVVFNNIIQSFRMIHDAMTEFSIPFENPESEVRSILSSFACRVSYNSIGCCELLLNGFQKYTERHAASTR